MDVLRRNAAGTFGNFYRIHPLHARLLEKIGRLKKQTAANKVGCAAPRRRTRSNKTSGRLKTRICRKTPR
ncbi:hypothetical protein [Kingella potus]|uniref:hypothetical protein n=1 Tax=Kingella potus TaxID=265175 RepID=UPI001FD39255|nr:hypothetical protein [Kingella potus]UOP01973.1 hypothetical protein LVJ84_04445 [Kingella potus]